MKNKNNAKKMNIMVSSNKKFLDYLMTMLFSLKKHNGDITIYFLNKDISEKRMKRFINQVKKEMECDCIEIKINKELCEKLPIFYKRISIETYLRLFAPFYLPDNLERILYIDVDVVVQKEIKDFYYQDFEEKSIIAIPDSMYKSDDIKERKEQLGLNVNHKYFNAGILIMNLNKIRNTISIDDILEIIDKKREILKYQDQDVLNLLFENDVKYESKYYNYQLIWKYSFDMQELGNAFCLHYTGKEKPWRIKCINEAAAPYWDIVRERGKILVPALILSTSKVYQTIRKCYFKIRGYQI